MDTCFKDSSIKKINVAFSGGGMVAFYHTGVCKRLLELYHSKQIDIGNIYGSSAGALAGCIFIYSMINPEFTTDKFMDIVHTQFKVECKKEYNRILPAWINIYKKILPEDIHLLCSNKLHIGIMVKENGEIIQKTISQYSSRSNLLNVLYVSASIPIFTILSPYSIYKNPVLNTNCPAIDGLFIPHIECLDCETLYINILKYNYALFKRIIYWERSYDFMVNDGYRDICDFFNKNKSSPIIYFYENNYNNKHKQYFYIWTNKLIRILVYLWLTIFT